MPRAFRNLFFAEDVRLLYFLEGHLHGALQLRIVIGSPVLRPDFDLFIGICSVVFNPPSDIGKPKGKFGLGRHRIVYQGVSWPDTDRASPGPLA